MSVPGSLSGPAAPIVAAARADAPHGEQGHFQIILNRQHCPLLQRELTPFMRLMYASGVWSYIVGAISTPFFIIVPMARAPWPCWPRHAVQRSESDRISGICTKCWAVACRLHPHACCAQQAQQPAYRLDPACRCRQARRSTSSMHADHDLGGHLPHCGHLVGCAGPDGLLRGHQQCALLCAQRPARPGGAHLHRGLDTPKAPCAESPPCWSTWASHLQGLQHAAAADEAVQWWALPGPSHSRWGCRLGRRWRCPLMAGSAERPQDNWT